MPPARKAEEQGCVSPDQMEQVREVTKRHRLKTDRFKMQQIHKIFKANVAEDDLEIYAANRNDIRRMAVACSQAMPEAGPIMATFRRLVVRDCWASMCPAEQASLDRVLAQTCYLIPYFISALGMDGSLATEGGESSRQTSTSTSTSSGTEPTISMHPPSSRDAPPRPWPIDENKNLNANSQVNAIPFNDVFAGGWDGSTIAGSACGCEHWTKVRSGDSGGLQPYGFHSHKDIAADWNSIGTSTVPGDLNPAFNPCCLLSPFAYPPHINPGPIPFTKAPGAVASFDSGMARGVWQPNPPPEYRQPEQIDNDLVVINPADAGS